MSTRYKQQVLEITDFIEHLSTLLEQEESIKAKHFSSLEPNGLPDCLKDAVRHLLAALEKRENAMLHPQKEMLRGLALQKLTLEVASLAPLQQVLERICETVQSLLQVDIGYIALYNEEKQTLTILASSNASPHLNGLTLRLGRGIGGRVVLTKRPLIMHDFYHETRREPDIDPAIESEGIISAIAVPLLLGPKVLGVLYAAMRVHREFTTEEVDFLSSLASLASVAIRNAQLYEKSQRLIRLHQQLSEAALQKQAVESIIQTLSMLLSCHVCLLDASGQILHHSGQNHRLNGDLISAVIRYVKSSVNTDTGHESMSIQQSDHQIVCSAIISNHVLVGILAAIRPGHQTYDEVDRIAFERATTLLALAISTQEIQRLNQFYQRTALLNQLLTQGEQEAILAERAKHLGINLWNPWHLVVSMCISDTLPPAQQEIINRMLRSIQMTLDIAKFPLSIVDKTCLVAAIPGQENLMARAQEMHALVESSLPQTKVLTVISEPCKKPHDYRQEYFKCNNALSWHERLGRDEPILWAKSFGLAGLLFDVSNLDAIKAFCVETLRPLAQDGNRNAGNLLETLKVYLENESELRATATSLHIHYNTLRYRLERIEQLLQINLNDSGTRQALRLALLLNDTFHFV